MKCQRIDKTNVGFSITSDVQRGLAGGLPDMLTQKPTLMRNTPEGEMNGSHVSLKSSPFKLTSVMPLLISLANASSRATFSLQKGWEGQPYHRPRKGKAE